MEKQKKDVIQELRARLCSNPNLTLEEEKLNNDQFLERFLHSNKWNVSKTEEMLNFYMRTNVELHTELTQPMKDYPVEIQELFKTVQHGGADYDNRPLVMVPSLSQVNFPMFLDKWNSNPEMMRLMSACYMKHHMIMEKLVLERGSDFGVAVLNLSGVQYSQYLHKKAFDFFIQQFKLIERHSPQITGKFIIINAPRIVKTLVNLVQKFLSFPVTVIVFGSHEKDWQERLRDHVPAAGISPEFGGTLSNFLQT